MLHPEICPEIPDASPPIYSASPCRNRRRSPLSIRPALESGCLSEPRAVPVSSSRPVLADCPTPARAWSPSRLQDKIGQSRGGGETSPAGKRRPLSVAALIMAPADGYSFIVQDGSIYAINPHIYGKMPYSIDDPDPDRDGSHARRCSSPCTRRCRCRP